MFFFGLTGTSASAARARAVFSVGRIIFIGILTDTRRAALSGTMGFMRKGCRQRVFAAFWAAVKCPILAYDVQSMLLSGLGSAALLARGVGTSIPSPAGGLRAVGLSFIGLSGLESGMLPSNPALCDLSKAICCCCCAPPRRYPGTCRTHHHHPSPGHSQTSISSLLTRPLAVCASFVPSP